MSTMAISGGTRATPVPRGSTGLGLLLSVVDAVVAELNVGGFRASFTAVRRNLPRRELTDLAALTVTVVPKSIEVAAASRAHNQYDCQVDLAVQQRAEDIEGTEVDDLLLLMDEIEERFRLAPLAQMPTAVWSRSEYTLPYFPEHLERDRVLTSVLTLTYRVFS